MNHSYFYVSLSLSDTYGHFQGFRLHLFPSPLFSRWRNICSDDSKRWVCNVYVTLCPEASLSPNFDFGNVGGRVTVHFVQNKIDALADMDAESVQRFKLPLTQFSNRSSRKSAIYGMFHYLTKSMYYVDGYTSIIMLCAILLILFGTADTFV